MPRDPEQDRARWRANYRANREARLAQQREYRRAHRDEINAQKAAYRRQNTARITASTNEWRRRNPEALRLHTQVHKANYDARLAGAGGRVGIKDVRYLPPECVYCGATTDLTVDHATPMSRGGANHWSNLTTACGTCNRVKGDRTVAEFLEVRRVA